MSIEGSQQPASATGQVRQTVCRWEAARVGPMPTDTSCTTPPPSSQIIWGSPGPSALRQSADEREEIPFPYHDTALAWTQSPMDGLPAHHSKPDGHRKARQAVDCKHLAFKSRCWRPQGWARGVGPMRGTRGREGQFWLIFCRHPLRMTPNKEDICYFCIVTIQHCGCNTIISVHSFRPHTKT